MACNKMKNGGGVESRWMGRGSMTKRKREGAKSELGKAREEKTIITEA